jgi:tetratricopeptide (TPR) repeat protein
MMKANLARAFYYSRQYDQAIATAQSCLKLEANYAIALRWLERAYRQKGMLAEAYAAQLAVSKPEERAEMERVYHASGYKGMLRLEAERYVQSGSLVEAARMYAQAGDRAKAMELLEETARRGWPGLNRLKIDPDFDPLREDSRFQQLIHGARLE